MKTLIIEIPYAGLGDHLFHSHIPRIAKETNKYDKVYISKRSYYRHYDYIDLTWISNPYVDGLIELPGKTIELDYIVKNFHNLNIKGNLLDAVMLAFDLDDGKRWHEPEIYYKPKFIENYNYTVYDPNFISYVGQINKFDVMSFMKKKGFSFDCVMKIRSEKALYVKNKKHKIIETPTLKDYCDLIYSCKKFYCLTSGSATLAAALNKPAIVFYGLHQSVAFQHSKLHTYCFVENKLINKIKNKVYNFFVKQ